MYGLGFRLLGLGFRRGGPGTVNPGGTWGVADPCWFLLLVVVMSSFPDRVVDPITDRGAFRARFLGMFCCNYRKGTPKIVVIMINKAPIWHFYTS